MSSKLSRRRTVVDRVKKLFKPTRSPTLPLPAKPSPHVSMAPEFQHAPAPRIFPLGNRSEGNIACELSRTNTNASSKTNASSSLSLGQRPRPTKGGKWYIPNETTIFPLPAPNHSAIRSQPLPPTSPSQGRERAPSLSTSTSSHGTGTSDLHTPNSSVENRQPQLWIPDSGTITPACYPKSPVAYRDGTYFTRYDDGGETREKPELAAASRGSEIGHNDKAVDTNLGRVPGLELRSPGWIWNEVEAIEDGEMKRLAEVAFL
jgi:hypothetical protein